MNIVFDPFIPIWAIAGLLAFGALLSIAACLRAWAPGVLRLLALAALAGLLLNPKVEEADREALSDIAIILVDKSASQQLDNRNAVRNSAATKLVETIDRLDGMDHVLREFGGETETQALSALQNALAETPRDRIGGVFILTDGQATDSDNLDTLRTASPAPVHVLLTGAQDERDRKITLINAPRYGIVKQPVEVSFRVDDIGPNDVTYNDGQQAMVTLRVNGEQILRQPVPLGAVAKFNAPLPRPGHTIVELEAAPIAGELTDRNNIAVLPISAVRDRLRVLLISGEPHAGERVWRNLLKSDPAVDLVHFTILRPIEKNDGTPISELALIPFPQDELFIDKLSEFDLIVFDRYTYRGVMSAFHFDNIARFVQEGGAVLIASGPEYNGPLSLANRRNLSFFLPGIPTGKAIETPFRPAVTSLGKRHPVTFDLPEEEFWGRWLRLMPVRQERGDTLMSGPDGKPLLILDRFEEGRVGLLLSDHVWLWARGFDGGGPHAELLRRIAHWLMKEPELEEEALSLSNENGDLLIQRRTIKEQAPEIILTNPDGSETVIQADEIAPGQYAVKVKSAARGLYRARSGDLFAIGEIGLSAVREFSDVVSSKEKLAPLADDTGGGVFFVRKNNDAEIPNLKRLRRNATLRAGSDWAGVLQRSASRVENIRTAPLAPPMAWLFLIGAPLLLAWLIESGRFRRKI